MIKSKAVDIIRALTPGEFKEFGRLVRSPYFNENSKLVTMYDEFKKHYPEFSKESFTKEKIYSKLFHGRKYNDGTMRKLLSGMQNLAEEFLAHLSFDKKSLVRKKLALLTELDERKLDRIFELSMEELSAVFKRHENFDDDYFKFNFELEVARINFRLGQGRGGLEPDIVLNSLLTCATYLICYCMIITFKLNQDVLVTKVSYDFSYNDTIIYSFIESLGPGKFLESIKKYAPEFYPVLAIFYNRFMIASGRDDDNNYYWELKKLVLNNIERFSKFEKHNLMLFLENSCDEKINSGKDFRSEMHDIHKEMFAAGIYTAQEKDLLSIIGYRKVIRTAIDLKEFNWAEQFMFGYLDKLPVEFRKDMGHYSLAFLNFAKKKFEPALENISKVKFEIYSVKFDVWTLKLQSLVELGYLEEALYSLDSYKHSLNNDINSPGWMKIRVQNFLNFCGKLVKFRESGKISGGSDRQKLIAEISESGELMEKPWLLEKAGKFIQ